MRRDILRRKNVDWSLILYMYLFYLILKVFQILTSAIGLEITGHTYLLGSDAS